MATTTTNFGWDIPQSTDLVKDGATAIAALGQDIDTALVDLKGGTTGQVLAKASNTDLDFTWSSVDPLTILDAKGDLITATAADTPARLAVGTNGQILTADSTTATGLAWATAASAGGMTSIASGSLSGSSLSLTSISGSYKDLRLVLRGATASSATNWSFTINNNTGAIYDKVGGIGDNTTFTGLAQVSQTSWRTNYNTVKSASVASLFINFFDYAKTSSFKQLYSAMQYENSAGSAYDSVPFTGSARDANAITRIDLSLGAGTFSAGTYILYGVN